jgi:cytochrome P450
MAAGKKDRGSIFHTLLESDLSPQDKQPERLAREAFVIAAAGGDTTAITISSILYHLIANPATLEHLRRELTSIAGEGQEKFSWTELEKLPYMTAVIKEGLRLSHGVSARIARCPADRDLHYKHIVIPRGTPVSMSNQDVHLDPDTFPEPTSFRPERWLSGTSEVEDHLSRYLVAFSKGTRQCLGMK